MAVEDGIAILTADGLPSGVEIITYLKTVPDGDILRQIVVETGDKCLPRQARQGVERYHLPLSVDAGIGATCPHDMNSFPC